jgi:hypothetical protein
MVALTKGDTVPASPTFQTYTVSLASGEATDTINMQGAKCAVAVCTGTAKWEVANSDVSLAREFSGAGLAQNPTATLCGILQEVCMPHSVRLNNTSGTTNAVTIYVYH